MIDLSPDTGRDPTEDLGVIEAELLAYSSDLLDRPRIVALNKIDLGPDPGTLKQLHAKAKAAGQVCVEVSAVTGAGLDGLVAEMSRALQQVVASTPQAESSA